MAELIQRDLGDRNYESIELTNISRGSHTFYGKEGEVTLVPGQTETLEVDEATAKIIRAMMEVPNPVIKEGGPEEPEPRQEEGLIEQPLRE